MHFPWTKHYDAHVPPVLEYPDSTIGELFDESVRKHGSRIAVQFMGKKISYNSMEKDAASLAVHLSSKGVRPGDRVFLLLPNTPHFVAAYYAVMKIGAVVVPASPLDTAPEIQYKIRNSGARVAVFLDLLFESLEPSLPLLEAAVGCDLSDYLPFPKNYLFPIKKRRLGRKMPPYNEKVIRFSEILKVKETFPCKHSSPDDLAVIIYTGGTTGISKGVMLSHRALAVNMTQARTWGQVTGDDINLCALPFFHGFGMSIGLNTTFVAGGRMLLLPKWDAGQAIRHFEKDGVTLFAAVPTMYNSILNHPDFSRMKNARLRGCYVGAAPVPESLKEEFFRRTGGILIEGYGLTEAVTAKSANPYIGKKKEKSIGIPWPDTEFRIVDEITGEASAPGVEGEIILRSPDLMMGYWQNPEATDEVLRDGWLFTGDIGRMDEDGYFYIVDRKKDLIISGGFNVYPSEIEEVLYSHPSVLEACVIGVRDTHKGEIPRAYVVLRQGEREDPNALMEFLGVRLIHYKVPRSFIFKDALPKSPIGKILRKELRAADPDVGSSRG